MKREDIINAYRLFLGREPEDENVIKDKLIVFYDSIDLCRDLLTSKEFNSKECIHRLTIKPTDKKSVITVYALLLGRLPENDDVITEHIQKRENIGALLQGITESAEYRSKCSNVKEDAIKESNIKNVLRYLSKDNIKYIRKDSAFNQAPKIIYLHIPKTAGSSFHQLASENLKGQVSLSMPSNINYDQWIHSKMIGGHYFYSHYDGMTADRLFLSVVRDPVERAFSLFNYYKHAKDGMEDLRAKMGFNPTSLRLTIEESDIDFRGEFVDNYQCLYLSGERNFNAFQNVIKNDYFIVGTFDKIDDWLKYLGEKLGWKSIIMPKINVSRKSTYMDELKSDSELVEMVRDLNKEDIKLYEHINSAGVFSNCTDDFDFNKFRM